MSITLIDKIFTSSDLATLYYTNKLKYNPKDYSFKDRLITHSFCDYRCYMYGVDYEAETILESLIAASGKKFEPLQWNSLLAVHDASDNLVTYPRCITGTPCFIKQDNMYFNPEHYLRYDNLNYNQYPGKHSEVFNEDNFNTLKHSEDFAALLQLHIALCSENSIAKHLIWQVTEWNSLHLKEIINLKIVADAISTGTTIPKIEVPEIESAMFSPVCTPYEVYDSWSKFVNTTENIAQLQISTYFKCIVFGLEVLHMLYTIPNPKYIHILEQKLSKNVSWVKDILYDRKGSGIQFANSDVEDIVNTNNPEERYSKIKKYLSDYRIEERITRLGFNISTPEWLLELCGFCNEYAIWNLRVQYVALLYKYCADNKLLDKLKSEDSKDYSTLISTLIGDTDSPGIGMSDETLKTSIMNLTMSSSYYKDDEIASDTSHPSITSPTYEALDKLTASYKDNKYSFDVKDVYKFEPDPKYEKIAACSELLNKTLIARIKEIKVYNTGGKNSGKSKGKLDRKALYRYKTCKDIFYDNTYKIKESDLAFGIILDVSGSMSGKGIENGIATMIVLHETLKALNINHSIITHTSDGMYHSEIKRYQAFKEDKTYSVRKNYALSSIKACWGNCDSGALYYMEKALSRVKNKDKICLIFSDGEPTECTGTDLKEQVRKMEHQGIKVIGIGIDYSNIKNFYSEYANGKTLAEMFNIVSDILKRYILEKED